MRQVGHRLIHAQARHGDTRQRASSDERGRRRTQGRDAQPAHPCLGACPRPGHRPDPGHRADRQPAVEASPQWRSRLVMKTSPRSTRSRWPGSPPMSATRLVACIPSAAEPLTARPNIQSTTAIFVRHRNQQRSTPANGPPNRCPPSLLAIVAAARSVSAQWFRRRHRVWPRGQIGFASLPTPMTKCVYCGPSSWCCLDQNGWV